MYTSNNFPWYYEIVYANQVILTNTFPRECFVFKLVIPFLLNLHGCVHQVPPVNVTRVAYVHNFVDT